MARPPWVPTTPAQRQILERIARVAAALRRDNEELTRLMEEALEDQVPITSIADAAELDRKTVYRRLGRPMR